MPRIPVDTAHCAIRLRAATSRLSRQLRAAVAADGIGIASFSVLGHLHRTGAMTPTELARCERVKLQTLTRLLAHLEADGWIQRVAHEHDGRQSVLSLTQKGAMQLTAHVQQREASLARAIEQQLSPEERARLVEACALIDRLAETLAAPAQAASA
jgi:DNA-binding MarR family transcriptional regulator